MYLVCRKANICTVHTKHLFNYHIALAMDFSSLLVTWTVALGLVIAIPSLIYHRMRFNREQAADEIQLKMKELALTEQNLKLRERELELETRKLEAEIRALEVQSAQRQLQT
jgi:uncharacterized membrane protein YciS (DUF1049 family)